MKGPNGFKNKDTIKVTIHPMWIQQLSILHTSLKSWIFNNDLRNYFLLSFSSSSFVIFFYLPRGMLNNTVAQRMPQLRKIGTTKWERYAMIYLYCYCVVISVSWMHVYVCEYCTNLIWCLERGKSSKRTATFSEKVNAFFNSKLKWQRQTERKWK